jgi:transcription initiation factor IIE alpha subunit
VFLSLGSDEENLTGKKSKIDKKAKKAERQNAQKNFYVLLQCQSSVSIYSSELQ